MLEEGFGEGYLNSVLLVLHELVEKVDEHLLAFLVDQQVDDVVGDGLLHTGFTLFAKQLLKHGGTLRFSHLPKHVLEVADHQIGEFRFCAVYVARYELKVCLDEVGEACLRDLLGHLDQHIFHSN